MANAEHLKILQQGVEVWNKWREENPEVRPDLSETDLSNKNLQLANLSDTYLFKAIFQDTNLCGSNLSGAFIRNGYFHNSDLSEAVLSRAYFAESFFLDTNFSGASLSDTSFNRAGLLFADFSKVHLLPQASSFAEANLQEANFSGLDLSKVDFIDANLSRTDLSKANLYQVKFAGAKLVKTNLSNANIERANIYGISAWNIKKDGLIQKDLIITPEGEPEITVDDLEVAQFIYLMLNNQNIRNVIETITSKAVLILGRFTEERKKVLDALKDELRLRNYLPIVFDFDKPNRRDIDETVNLLARMSRFVVADVTDAKSIPQELKGFVEGNPSIPIVPLILEDQNEYAMFEHFRRYPWVLSPHVYASPDELLSNIIPAIIAPAERKVEEVRQ